MGLSARCTNCGRPYPDQGAPFACPHCGGIYDLSAPLVFAPESVQPELPGIWRYRQSFGLPENAPVLSLGEGQTPLIWKRLSLRRRVAFKCEFENPSGSFKDRGTAVLLSALLSRGVRSVVEDSSGNAGASLAAYAAKAGLSARIFVPDTASETKQARIRQYGADLERIPGPRSAAAEAVQKKAQIEGLTYASHAWLPFNLPGYATLAYELYEQLGGRMPGAVIMPVGQGGLLLGVARGFDALHAAGLGRPPQLIGVQALACAPFWALSRIGFDALGFVQELPTVAEGIRVRQPLRGDAVLQAVAGSGGQILAVPEEEILPARDQLALRGLYVEPTSAVVWAALRQLPADLPEPWVFVLTGNGA